MNPIFNALAAVALGMLALGGDAYAAPHAGHHEPARKAAPAAKAAPKAAAPKAAPAKAAPSKQATAKPAAATKSAPPKKGAAKADKNPAVEKNAAGKVDNRKGAAAKAAPEPVGKGRNAKQPPAAAPQKPLTRAELRAQQAAERKAEREARRGKRGAEQAARPAPVVEAPANSRQLEPVRPAARGEVAEPVKAAPASRAGIGREAFTPNEPPMSRTEAMRRLQSQTQRAPAPAVPPPVRPTVTLPAPVTVPPAAAKPLVEAPKPAPAAVEPPRVSAAVVNYRMGAEMSAAESAAAAAAALKASAPAPAPAPAAPAAPAAVAPAATQTPTPAPAVAAPAPAPTASVSSPLATPIATPSRSSRGVSRAYAMDGATFYQSGRKYRVQGLDARDPGMTSEHATQRLQRALDAGSVSVEPVEVDGAGHTIAVVRVNGRNVADTVRGTN